MGLTVDCLSADKLVGHQFVLLISALHRNKKSTFCDSDWRWPQLMCVIVKWWKVKFSFRVSWSRGSGWPFRLIKECFRYMCVQFLLSASLSFFVCFFSHITHKFIKLSPCFSVSVDRPTPDHKPSKPAAPVVPPKKPIPPPGKGRPGSLPPKRPDKPLAPSPNLKWVYNVCVSSAHSPSPVHPCSLFVRLSERRWRFKLSTQNSSALPPVKSANRHSREDILQKT